MEKIAQCGVAGQPKRALLSLATGAGKTSISVNLLKRISDAGQLTRALFVCDRDELRTQALKTFQNVFGSDAVEVYRNSDSANNAKNARIHISTYQTLGIKDEFGDSNFLTEFYPENFFSHVVIDECHRSAWGKWSQVLTRNRSAVQIGLTARRLTSSMPARLIKMARAVGLNRNCKMINPIAAMASRIQAQAGTAVVRGSRITGRKRNNVSKKASKRPRKRSNCFSITYPCPEGGFTFRIFC